MSDNIPVSIDACSIPAFLNDFDVSKCGVEEVEAIYSLASRLSCFQMENLPVFGSPNDVKCYLRNRYMGLGHEIFGVMFLDNAHRVIVVEEVSRGTLDSASVYPREIAKLALKYNSAAVVFFHNHPTGQISPSLADKTITKRLKSTLDLLDVRVLDHLIIGKAGMFSFAEDGLL